MKQKIILIDGNSLIFKGYYASLYSGRSGYMMQTSTGKNTSALVPFITMLNTILNSHSHSHLLVLFDTGKPTFRKELAPHYKSSRGPCPADLIEQFAYVREYLDSVAIKYESRFGYEADDLIGSYAKYYQEQGFEVAIFTGDKDLLQLVDTHIKVNILVKGASMIEEYNIVNMVDKTQLSPSQYLEYMALAGDPSDDIKGIPGVGVKTAINLLLQFGSIENLVNNLEAVKSEKIRNNIKENLSSLELDLKLVTILTNLPPTYETASLAYEKVYESDQLLSFLEKYEINQKSRSSKKIVKRTEKTECDTIKINSILQLEQVLKQTKSVYLHLPINENYHRYEFTFISFSDGENNYVLTDFTAKMLDKVVQFFAASKYKVTTYNLKALYSFILSKGYDTKLELYDVMLGNYVLYPNLGGMSLEEIALSYNIEIVSYLTISLETNLEIKQILITEYCGQMAQVITKIRAFQEASITSKNLNYVLYEIEFPLSYVLAKMEYSGLLVDTNKMKSYTKSYTKILDNLQKEIYFLANCEFNIQSPKQLQQVLFDQLMIKPLGKTKKSGGYSTNQEVLEGLINVHPIIGKILQYRKVAKILQTYLEGFNKELFKDHKLHTIYTQTVTKTGRLSSISPNLQNIPSRDLGAEIRDMFIPENDVFLSFDYSQVELRILAHISNSPNLIRLFEENEDIHTSTACDIFGVTAVTSEMRQAAKAVNFGIIYGLSPFGLSKDLAISVAEATQYLKVHKLRFPQVHAYMSEIIHKARTSKEVSTLFKRVRYLEYGNQNHINEQQDRLALNTPIQGTAADIIKLAMIKIQNYLIDKKLQSKLIMQIHDELIFDVVSSEVDLLTNAIPKLMNSFDLKVPLLVNKVMGKSLKFD